MYTRCPTCSTCFRVTDRHLAIAKGKVRCGQCQHIFNAPEHAIDDLPANSQSSNKPAPSVTSPAKIEHEKSVHLSQEKKAVETADIVEKEIPQTHATEAEATKTPVKENVTTETKVTDSVTVEADATVVADTNNINKETFNELDLKTPPVKNNDFDDDDDLFDDSFDLNAAIDEFTHDAEDSNDDNGILDEASPVKETQSTTPETKNNDVFTTDAYDATSALSVSDIMDEMEGQLSLNIPEPDHSKTNDLNHEFDFIELDNKTENSIQETEETNDQTLEKYFDINENEDNKTDDTAITENAVDEFSFIESEDEIINEITENETIEDQPLDEDELFDEIDLSDFPDSGFQNSETNAAETDNSEKNTNDTHIPFQLRDDINQLQTTSKRRIHPLFSFSFILILLAVSFSQIAYFRAHELVTLVPSTRPLLETFCKQVNCHYSGPSDFKKIQLISRDVRLHPKQKKALLISAAIINNAHFAQPYPNIHIRLSDISGNVVAERIFNAKTYMGKLNNPFLLMKPKTPVHINFEVVDPGRDAINFEFSFL